MFFRQIVQKDLGCASYVIADNGEAVVIDPQWEVEPYLAAARDADARILHVLETHNHADHVSGRLRLIAATGAVPHVPADPTQPGSPGLRGGDRVRVGGVEVRAVAAPGHRPEHLAYVVHTLDHSVPDRLLSGDSLLVGAVARPDLAVAEQEGAEALFETLRRLEALGDEIEVWPAHLGGSLCGSGSLTEASSSTIGTERQTNPLMSLGPKAAFVAEITASSPARPPRVERVVSLNVAGAEEPPPLRRIGKAALSGLISEGACVLDTRPSERFDAAHLLGALNLPGTGTGLGNRAGWVTRPDEPIVIVADSEADGAAFADHLYAAGIWSLEGIAVADVGVWSTAGLSVRSSIALTPRHVAAGLADGRLDLLDVRDDSEWRLGHVSGSLHLPLSVLGDGSRVELARDRPLAVACGAGSRAALAASVLRRRGYRLATRMTQGIPSLLSLLS